MKELENMSNEQPEQLSSSTPETAARLFTKFGWIGFWIQVVMAILPIVMLIMVLVRNNPNSPPERRFDLREYAAFGSLLLLLFTMLWSYRYTRIARRMLIPEQRPPSSSLIRNLWIGILAGCLGALISILLLQASVGRLLILFMNAPQGGMQVIQTATESRAKWVSTIDMLDLMTMVLTLTAEFTVMALSLWLLFRMLQWATAYDRVSDAGAALDADRESLPTP